MDNKSKQPQLIAIINLVSIALLIVLAALFTWTLNLTTHRGQAHITKYNLTANANRFMKGSALLTNEVRAYAATADVIHYDNYIKEVNTEKNTVVGIQNMKDIGLTKEEEAIVEKMLALSNKLIPFEETAMSKVKEGNLTAALDAVYGKEYTNTLFEIASLQSDFLSKLDHRTDTTIDSINSTLSLIQIIVFAFLLLIAALQISLRVVVQKRLVSPIKQINDGLSRISKGELSTPFEINGNTSEVASIVAEIQTLKSSLSGYIADIEMATSSIAVGNFVLPPFKNDFVGDFSIIKVNLDKLVNIMSNTLNRIKEAAEQVSSGSDQVSNAAQALAQGATEQASSVQELSASIGEISHQVKSNAENAARATQLSDTSMEAIQNSNLKMQELMSAMDEINEKSAQINKINKTIQDIAFQTNILALNAAVEAARAGTAGKGFAVVADEVRNLASKSADAAKETTHLIESSVVSIEVGVRLANQTAQELARVVDSARSTTKIVGEISTASKDQSVSLSEVSQGIEQISAVVQTNSATSEQSAAASEELSSQSTLMKQLVSRFILKDTSDIDSDNLQNLNKPQDPSRVDETSYKRKSGNKY